MFFYDGQHSLESQYYHLAVMKPLLAKYSVVLVDDYLCSISRPYEMTLKAIKDFRYKMHYFVELPCGQCNYHTGQGLFILENLP